MQPEDKAADRLPAPNSTTRMNTACRILPIAEFAAIAPAWDTINNAHYTHPLLESRFVAKTLEHLGTGRERIAVVGADGSPDAIAVLTENRLGAWGTFQASQSPLGAMILRSGADIAGVAKALFAGLPLSCQILSLTQQDPDILPRPDDQPRLASLDYIDTARITIDRGFDDYWASRGKNLRHNMKRQRNRLEREGTELRLETLSRPEQMREGVKSYGDLESLGWKAEQGTAVHLDNEQGRFYAAMLEDYAETGNARIYRYYYNNRLSAVDLCIHNGSAFIILKTTYDESVQTSSPALLMRREYFPPIFDNHEAGRIEFYGKVMDWHTKWSDEIRTLYHVNAYRNALVARIHLR
ncbi:MAG: GNAT family N-acetyltransferase [Planctomycetales bacterium]|nr:GNAT family N-acetyltransferase [Planctomycetales bacterium]